MAMIDFAVRSPLSPADAWRRLTDWERHGAVVPLTRVHVLTGPPTRTGTRFVARTGLGPVGFDDPMEVVTWQPPRTEHDGGRCRLAKHGRFVLGWAEITTEPTPGGTLVHWREDLRVRHLPRWVDPALRGTGRRVFTRAVHRLLTAHP